jgi:hypothetical protein
MRRGYSFKKILMLLLVFSMLSLALCIAADEAKIKKSDEVLIVPSSLSDKTVAKDQSTLSQTSGNQMPLTKVPLDAYRRAAQLVEEMRGSEMAPGWESAKLKEISVPFYRPDIEGVAYYEFQVEPTGFIIVSATNKDFPIPHWSSTDESISSQLSREAEKSGKSAAKYYKLDSLSYAVEDANGELAGSIGDMPSRIMGMDPAWLKAENFQANEAFLPVLEGVTDDNITDAEREAKISGQESSPVEFSGWDSWNDLKAGYIESYGVFLQAMNRDAAKDWDLETMAKKSGEGMVPGDKYDLVLLYTDAKYEVMGDGKEFASVNLKERKDLPSILEIIASAAPPSGQAELDVKITYPTENLQEDLKFMILDPGKVNQTQPSLLEKGAEVSPDNLKTQGDWGPWHFFWTGRSDSQTHDYQRLFSQFTIGSCSSGCGATAWAMLFGWADHQAAISNPIWQRHWGIYRQDGGRGPDVDAPRNMDNGIRNIISEIRGYIGTTCVLGNAPTLPSSMINAQRYLWGRDNSGIRINWFFPPLPSVSQRAKEAIVWRRSPVIIGTGFLSHYPLAYGYAWRSRLAGWWPFEYTQYSHWFYVNQGWGGSSNGWVSDTTWFAAELLP